MKIFIPSRSRAHLIHRGPAAQLPMGITPMFVVPEDQVDAYHKEIRNREITAGVLGMRYNGIAEKRKFIGRLAADEGHDKFCMLDDDIGFLVRKSPELWNLRPADKADVREMFFWIQKNLDNYQQVGVSAREGNNRPGPGDVNSLVDVNTRCMRVLAYQTKVFNSLQHGRVPFMEDFDISLQILERGGCNIMTYWWAQGQGKTNDRGGCSDYRTLELHEEAAHKLYELHPNFVSLRQKKNKTDTDGFGTRTECTIQWKRAAKAGGWDPSKGV